MLDESPSPLPLATTPLYTPVELQCLGTQVNSVKPQVVTS